MKSKYIVFYIENAAFKDKQFKTLKAAEKFADKHELKNKFPYSDDWVDYIVLGRFIKRYPMGKKFKG